MSPEEIVEEHCFYRLAEGDLLLAKSYIKAIENTTNAHYISALIQCAILSYCRPFKECKGIYKKYRLSKKFIPKNCKAIHEEMISYRDRVFAHTDVEMRNPKLLKWQGKNGFFYPMQFKSLSPQIFVKKMPDIMSAIISVQNAIADKLKSIRPYLDKIE